MTTAWGAVVVEFGRMYAVTRIRFLVEGLECRGCPADGLLYSRTLRRDVDVMGDGMRCGELVEMPAEGGGGIRRADLGRVGWRQHTLSSSSK